MKIIEGGYEVTTVVDEDGHLSIFVKAEDGSPVHDVGEDIGADGEFAVRLTTESIEAKYIAQQDKPNRPMGL